MSDTIKYCVEHEFQMADEGIRCFRSLVGGSPCRMVELRLAPVDAIVIERDEDGRWPDVVVTTMIESFTSFDPRGDFRGVLDALAASQGEDS